MIIDALGDPREVGPLLRALVLGRYSEESKNDEKNWRKIIEMLPLIKTWDQFYTG